MRNRIIYSAGILTLVLAFFIFPVSTSNAAPGDSSCGFTQLEQRCQGQESFGGLYLICRAVKSGGQERCYAGGCGNPVIRVRCGGIGPIGGNTPIGPGE